MVKFAKVSMPSETRNGITVGAIKSWKSLPENGVITILGEQGEGKSVLAYWIAEQAHKRLLPGWPKTGKSREVLTFALPAAGGKLLPKYFRNVQSISELKNVKDAIVIYDETARAEKGLNARRAMKSQNVDSMELNGLARQFGHLIIYIAQHSKQPDPDVIINSKLVLHKHPSVLHIRFARPELKPEYDLAMELFGKIPEKKWKEHTVVIDYKRGQAGVLRNGMASFWSEKLSVIFASAAEPKKKGGGKDGE